MLLIPEEISSSLNHALTTPGFVSNIEKEDAFETTENLFEWLTGVVPETSESLFGEKVYETTKIELKPMTVDTRNMYIFLAFLGCGITARQHTEEGTPVGFFAEPLTKIWELVEDTIRVRPPKDDEEATAHLKELWG